MNVGLVLSGGMAKGAYQIGALRALEKFIPLNEIKYMSCASVGVLNGYAYATGNLDRAEKIWRSICTQNTRYFITQILKSSMLQYNISNLYDPEKELPERFYCSLFDYTNKNLVYKDLSDVDTQKIPKYLTASVAMPVYNRSVNIDNVSYFDGAMIDNIPVYPISHHDLDYLICVYFDESCTRFENPSFDKKIIKITFPCCSLIKQSVFFDQDNIDDMINSGYERAMQVLEPIFAEGYDNVDRVYREIEKCNEGSKNEVFRITGDLLISNLNKITQRLAKRRIQ